MRKTPLRLLLFVLVFAAMLRPLHVHAQDNSAPSNAPATAQANAQAAAPATAPGTSDSGEIENRLLFRVRKALRASAPAQNNSADNLGVPGGYHWIILMQVARYSDSNLRLTNMRRGVQRFLETLSASRLSWPRAQVQDTVSVLPYHFGLLGEARGRLQPLAGALDDTAKLKELVPGLPQDDKYQGQLWRDGHDWRASMQSALAWMQSSDIEPERTVFIVLDWNDLAQAPLTLADGSKPAAPATDRDLVLPTNAARFKDFADAMQSAGLDPKKNLETVQVGNLEYDLGVFTPQQLQPIPATTGAAPAPIAPPSSALPKTQSGSGIGPGLIILALIVLGGAGFFLMRPVNFRLDEQESRQVSFLPAKTLPILGKKAEASGPHFRLSNVNLDTERPLATILTDFSKKLLVTNGALNVQNSEGFDVTPAGLRLRGARGEFDLVDSATGRVVTSVSIRRL